jgi:hypothetical protein
VSITTDLTAYLIDKGHQVYRAAGQEITAHCWFCPDGDPRGKGKLYFNTESWLWDCKRCGKQGNRKTLLAEFGDHDDTTYLPGSDPGMRRKALSEAVAVAEEALFNNAKRLEELSARGLSMETVVDARLGLAPKNWSLSRILRTTNTIADLKAAGLINEHGHDTFDGHLLIPFFSHGDVVQIRGRAVAGQTEKYKTPPGDAPRLFNADALHGARQAILVEGEFDALILQQHLRNCQDPVWRETAVVAISGSGYPTGLASYFEACTKVYLAMDPDDAGEKHAVRIKELLGSKARRVELPRSLPKCDWTEYLRPKTEQHPHGGHTWRDVVELLEIADASGRRLYTVGDAYRQHSQIEAERGGIYLGFQSLDALIGPGVKPGQIVIPIARTGVGKSNFLFNVIWNLRERPQLLISLEMTAPEVYARLRMLAHFWAPLATDREIQGLLSNLRIYDQRMKYGDLPRLVEEFREETGLHPHVVHVDYIGYYAQNVAGSSQYERTTKAVIGLKEEAKACEVVMVAPHQAGRSNQDGTPVAASDARDSGAIEDTADIMLGLYRPSDHADRESDPNVTDGVLRLQVLKNRNGRKGSSLTLAYSYASLVLVDGADRANRHWVDQENTLIFRGETYDKVRRMRMHHAGIGAQLELVRAQA